MSEEDRISRIHTLWSVVRRAHTDESIEARSAQQQLLDRYGKAIQRYLIAALKDPAAADDAYQEFALRFVKGDYGSADPEKGRFRSFLKTILFRLIIEHHRGRKRRRTAQMTSDLPEPAVIDEIPSDEMFQQSWCDELLTRAWQALKDKERQTGRPLFTVMRARVDHPDWSSTELASALSDNLGKTVSAANVRVMLHRSRDEFAALLLSEVADTLDRPSKATVEDELIQLGLLEYCRPALSRLEDD